MLGGDLRFHLERMGHVPEGIVKFWMAELACGLEYLHSQRIIHRDLKPDNILLDAMGHAHITDFNVAIHYSDRRLHTSLAGSMAYMAPQVVSRKGYTWHIDWWSLGVTAYELIFRKRPFDGKNAEKMTQSILKDPLKFPDNASSRCSGTGIAALQGFIERDPEKRLGCRPDGQGFRDIRAHPWFESINWDKLEDKECQPPFVPDMEKANFDVSHELDEFLMVEKPLTHSKRKINPDLDKMKPELRQLEEQFTVYDFTTSRRLSYYPHNQPVTTVSTSTDDSERTASQSLNGTLVPTATIAERSQSATPTFGVDSRYAPAVPSSHGHAET
ncbi:hypothetical protein H0H92_009801 [Tricholoma furcatifolium]|nr:hypothetical protein H0H92_009801 [Tricholoma furcatifolium]